MYAFLDKTAWLKCMESVLFMWTCYMCCAFITFFTFISILFHPSYHCCMGTCCPNLHHKKAALHFIWDTDTSCISDHISFHFRHRYNMMLKDKTNMFRHPSTTQQLILGPLIATSSLTSANPCFRPLPILVSDHRRKQAIMQPCNCKELCKSPQNWKETSLQGELNQHLNICKYAVVASCNMNTMIWKHSCWDSRHCLTYLVAEQNDRLRHQSWE
jgi:hypothetical protein